MSKSAMKSKISPGGSSGLSMSNFKSSQNYLWNTNAVLGKGATGAVYFGHNKHSGETVAVKCFNHLSHMRPYEVQKREFEVLKKVNHENIVKLLAIEEENDTKQKVLVMELCTGGSLFNILDDPLNSNGLDEKEFLLVLKHLAAGMKHLRDMNIIHRDLKPGNIMKFVSEDGTSIYKLTDFGAARELDDDQQFMSLYGTEEYLHPDMYERAVLRKPVGKSFKANVDLWSIGVTLYHIATGSLPFRPYGGRKNKETMYKITTEKSSGIISGTQPSENGEIKWSRNLPESCLLSASVQPLVTELLAGLLECDAHRMWSFEKFFSSVTTILEHKVIYVFYVGTLSLHAIYCHTSGKISDLKSKFDTMYKISPADQIIVWNNDELNQISPATTPTSNDQSKIPLVSGIKRSTMISTGIAILLDDIPLNEINTTESTPLFLLNGQMNSKIRSASCPITPSKFPDIASTQVNTDVDAQYAKLCSSLAYTMLRHIDKFVHNYKLACLIPPHMLKLIDKNIKQLEEKYASLSCHLHVLKERLDNLLQLNGNLAHLIKVVIQKTKSNSLQSLSLSNMDPLKVQFEKIYSSFKSLSSSSIMDEKLEQLKDLWPKESDSTKLLISIQSKAKIFTAKIRESWLLLHKDKQIKSLNHHEEQLHQLEKMKLDNHCKKLNDLVIKEINPCVSIADKLEEWYQGAQVAYVKPQLIILELVGFMPSINELENNLKMAQEDHTKAWNLLLKEIKRLEGSVSVPLVSQSPTSNDLNQINGSLLTNLVKELESLRETTQAVKEAYREHELICSEYPERRAYDDYDRNDNSRQSRVSKPNVYDGSYFEQNRPHSDSSQQRQVTSRPRFDWNRDGQTPRYEWSRQYYQSSTTTSARPDYRRYYESSNQHRGRDRDDTQRGNGSNYQRTVSVSRGTSRSDGRHLPGPYKWYNETWHWSDNRTRGYDPDLDGTTLPPEPDKTLDEEEWDGTDFYRPPFDDRHPLAIYTNGRCDDYQACYPATGNLLIGREDRLKASSTCGLRQQVRYCVVSHLKEKKKCFYCDSRDKFRGTARYHGIENIVSRIGKKRRQFWWQAENGIEDVFVQFDLEAEFHFTHLVITFKTFRPAAMLIERSHDFGRTWQVYQYFASDCASSFPGVMIGPRNRITDVICDSQYSAVEPSTEGEVIFRVLPPNIHIDDPYSKEVQDMLKITNLRINFTKLHNLGDNLLDPRIEIKEKYYYSIYDMVVRGSCSCYGHASRCIPSNRETVPDMVYGKCECTHHTKGLNCEFCEDLYNDLEWKPAVGRQTNACKKCNCNNHASRCHFDRAVYHATGNVSGGVCDDCQHNTMGLNCEMCKTSYYQDPNRSLDDPYVCQQCDCDPRGSKDDGNCDQSTNLDLGMEAGKCHCKKNVEGRRCDHCKPGFWNLHEINPDGCEACSCNQLGTVGNLGCNVNTGECVCKRNVVGRDCNQCAPNYYGLSADEEGCKFCDCDPGGSYSQSCDQETGQCRCRPHVTGRRCDTPESDHFVPFLDHLTYEAEDGKTISGSPRVVPRQPFNDQRLFWSGIGFMRFEPHSGVEFVVDNIPTSKVYDVVVRFEPEITGRFDNAQLVIKRPYGIDKYGPCSNYSRNSNDLASFSLSSTERHTIINSVCLEKGQRYLIELKVNEFERPPNDRESPSILIDSISLVPRVDDIDFFKESPEMERRRVDFERRCLTTYHTLNRIAEIDEYCRSLLMSVGFYVYDGAYPCNCDLTGSSSSECQPLGGQCICKVNVAERTCSRCHVGFYGFGPDGCKACDCHGYGSLDNYCDHSTGQCNCRPETYGRQCDECQPGYWSYPNCQRCNCNGFSDLCDSKTGSCINCRANTSGTHCNECAEGYYGDPLGVLTGSIMPCRQCPCPGVLDSGMSHAKTCELDPRSGNVICHCHVGYSGERCDHCDENYYGDPNLPGSECIECECNQNTDISQPGNCDRHSGECLKCLYNTGGAQCQECKPGFYGNALEHSCAECICHPLGTDPRSAFCNQTSGQCSCLPNVEGQSCNVCANNHWNLASNKGCEACDCDPQGSLSMKCNEIDGQCHCKPTFGGRRCDECLPNHWGDPRVQCQLCDCNLSGSQSMQCDKTNGSCVCISGISGARCDRCARGFTGTAPHCEACGECFDNWDLIIEKLKNETFSLLDKARTIKQTGTTGAYTKQFTQIELNLNEVDKILKGQNINERELELVERMISEGKSNLNALKDTLNNHEKTLDDTKSSVIDLNFKLDGLLNKSAELKLSAEDLKEQALALQEANVEGAYNITKDAQRRSRASKNLVQESINILLESENKRRNTESLIDQTRGKHNLTFIENEGSLRGIQREISEMEGMLPNINHMVCDGHSTIDDCHTLCGGAGCGRCGGVSCTKGATTKSSNALDMAKNAESLLNEKDRQVKDELRRITEARIKSDEALEEARAAFNRIMQAKNKSENTASEVNQLLEQINKFMQDEVAQPADIRKLAEDCKKNVISLTPDEIRKLASEINSTIAGLKDINRILDETRDSLIRANDLKIKADQAKTKANDILALAERVKQNLAEAKQAQEKAKQSIDQANQAIDKIGQDMTSIDSEAGGAKDNAEKAASKIEQLNQRLRDVNQKYASNQFNIENAQREAINATSFANEANRHADDLEKKYQQAELKLKQKSQVSDDLKKRAKNLKSNASELLGNVSRKLQMIEEFENDIDNNEHRLDELRKKIEELDKEMKNHLEHIERQSKYYRECQA